MYTTTLLCIFFIKYNIQTIRFNSNAFGLSCEFIRAELAELNKWFTSSMVLDCTKVLKILILNIGETIEVVFVRLFTHFSWFWTITIFINVFKVQMRMDVNSFWRAFDAKNCHFVNSVRSLSINECVRSNKVGYTCITWNNNCFFILPFLIYDTNFFRLDSPSVLYHWRFSFVFALILHLWFYDYCRYDLLHILLLNQEQRSTIHLEHVRVSGRPIQSLCLQEFHRS